ncbi:MULTISPECIES: UDP-3-O-acyl-N-acetylglucosamine deacetylase [unclassified Bradyrhizobium]|uniref:UDP-3-O-acyl-N-acetylglucosamine deacetylase n=1 Tax=unclassified Bradyrhizobium TaxID=2631580 RepID=UPI00211EA067|nr:MULTISPECIES: UDP-3-O-acyl-N-acetylglucosamine deacetylase [unclassified Bradyrhizobium]
MYQTTIRAPATLEGVGVHSGLPASLTIEPAGVDQGIVFVRTGLDGGSRQVQAVASSVVATDFATVLGDGEGPLVSTAEHVLAAVRGVGLDNAIIRIDGPEVPIMDGSAAAFVSLIDRVGLSTQSAARRLIKVLKPIRVEIGDSFGELRPYSQGFRVEVEFDFSNPAIGHQRYVVDVTPESFRLEIASARTFGLMEDVSRLWAAGFALGASFENTIVFNDTGLLNRDGLRYADECARHKVLDVLGDFALAGLPLIASIKTVRGGHKLNTAILTALLADNTAWVIVEAGAGTIGKAGQLA